MKCLKRIVIFVVSMTILCIIGFIFYSNDYYHADEVASSIYQEDTSLIIQDDYLIIPASYQRNITFIFYPGAKVEYYAYLPLFKQLSEHGITTYMMKMPLNFAFLDVNAANKVIDDIPLDHQIYMVGHSLGGAMASDYATKHKHIIDGLILLGSYNYGEYNDAQTLTIYGTFNDNLTPKIEGSSNVLVIEGGNHAQFGNYGEQKGDPKATISDLEQQQITVDAILDFID